MRTGNNSSSKFAVNLKIDAAGRLLLLPAAALAAGTLIILRLPVAPFVRAALLFAWLVLEGRQLFLYASRSRRFARLSIAGDGCLGREASGRWVPLEMHGASFIGCHFLWLRFALADGSNWQTLLCRSRLSPHCWRRLHVVLRFRR